MTLIFNNRFKDALPRSIQFSIHEWDHERWARVDIQVLFGGWLSDLNFSIAWHKEDANNLNRQLSSFLAEGSAIDFEPMEPSMALRVTSAEEVIRMELFVDPTFIQGGMSTGSGITAVIFLEREELARALYTLGEDA